MNGPGAPGGTAPGGTRGLGRGLLAAVRFYQRAISPALPPRCRFHPTCSAYAVEAIERHGPARGCWLAVRRLARCAPWHPGGVDLVPGTGGAARSSSGAEPQAETSGDAVSSPTTTPRTRRRASQEESSVA